MVLQLQYGSWWHILQIIKRFDLKPSAKSLCWLDMPHFDTINYNIWTDSIVFLSKELCNLRYFSTKKGQVYKQLICFHQHEHPNGRYKVLTGRWIQQRERILWIQNKTQKLLTVFQTFKGSKKKMWRKGKLKTEGWRGL